MNRQLPESRWVKTAPRISQALVVILWLLTFLAGLAWLLDLNLPFKPEPLTFLLGVISTAVTAIHGAFTRLLEDRARELESEKYSSSYALAFGYVNHFLEPAITQLLLERQPDDPPLQVILYIPEQLDELSPAAIQRTLARIKLKDYSYKTVKLEFKEGRARDLLLILGEKQGACYFDFPSTLLTLDSLLDYKLATAPKSSDPNFKNKLGKVYIDRFHLAVQQLAEQKGLTGYISYTGKDLAFLEEAEKIPAVVTSK